MIGPFWLGSCRDDRNLEQGRKLREHGHVRAQVANTYVFYCLKQAGLVIQKQNDCVGWIQEANQDLR